MGPAVRRGQGLSVPCTCQRPSVGPRTEPMSRAWPGDTPCCASARLQARVSAASVCGSGNVVGPGLCGVRGSSKWGSSR